MNKEGKRMNFDSSTTECDEIYNLDTKIILV